jgi:hypothetical protein
MKENRSLELSTQLQLKMREGLLGPIMTVFPHDVLKKYTEEKGKRRNRVYTLENTLVSMVVSSTNEDKTLQKSVMTFKEIFKKNQEKEISLNTASYTEARQRLPYQALKAFFEARKKIHDAKDGQWYGRKTYIADGTYVQMQDSEELSKKYGYRSKKDPKNKGYPQGLLECIIEQRSGCIHQYDLASRHYSELDLIVKQMKNLPERSLVLADALYECRAVFQVASHLNLDIIVPLKRKQFQDIPESLTMRRITYSDSQDTSKKHVLLTSILDPSIPAKDIIVKYQTRWDIEISIREIKTIMHLNVLRSKSEDMIFKELASAMIAYNLIRKIMSDSSKESGFSPKADIFFSFYSIGKNILIDKKGRLYQRWSPGRYGSSKKTHSLSDYSLST